MTIRRRVSWRTVVLFALLMAVANGFWATGLRGAVGFIGSQQDPFRYWLLYVVFMLPLYLAAVVGALALSDRLTGGRRGLLRLGSATVLVAIAGTAVGVGQLGVRAVEDYRAQVVQLEQMHALHATATPAGATAPAPADGCDALCNDKAATRATHVRGIEIVGGLMLLTNGVLVLWGLAMRGGQVWVRRRPVAVEAEVSGAVAIS